MRYRFYRVHKYVCYELSELDREIAKTDFSANRAIEQLKQKFNALLNLLEHHSVFEDEGIHTLLRKKNSQLQAKIEHDHHAQEDMLANLKTQLDNILLLTGKNEKIMQGNEFYLGYRLFYSEMLKHLYDEEKVLLPELQRLYTDEELAAFQAKTYAKMTPEQMLDMLKVLFPHLNPEDKAFFLAEMKEAEQQKFEQMTRLTDKIDFYERQE